MPPATSTPSISRSAAYLMMALGVLVGYGALGLVYLFFFMGSLHLVDLGLKEPAALGLDACLCLAFFIQHSGMIRKTFRRWSARFIPSHYQGASYAIVSGIVLLMLVMFWQESAYTLASARGAARWALRALYLLSLGGFAWGALALESFDAFGIAQIRSRLRGVDPKPVPFTVRGPYRWVRHPLYFSCLIAIWSFPDVTVDRLLLNVLWTAWIVVGTVLEERDLVAALGPVYRDYQRRVPMLIPYRRPQG